MVMKVPVSTVKAVACCQLRLTTDVAGKFGSSAGEVIAEALVRARAEGTSRIGEEHLFAALLAMRVGAPTTR